MTDLASSELGIRTVDADYARSLTDRIKIAVEGTWHLITEAYTSRAWSALGYPSWDDYCTREFGTSRLRLPREDRSEVVASLRESGLSIRAIEAATGISRKTVIKDLRSEVVETPPPAESDPLPELTDREAADLAEAIEAEVLDDDEPTLTEEECEALADPADLDDEPEPERITGMDGKSYPKPQQSTPKRRAITDSFWQATFDLGKKVNTLTNLAADDRFKRNADQLAERNLNDLIRIRDELQLVIDQLSN